MRVSTKCAVAVVNGSPLGCQSRHRARRSELSAKLTEGETFDGKIRECSLYHEFFILSLRAKLKILPTSLIRGRLLVRQLSSTLRFIDSLKAERLRAVQLFYNSTTQRGPCV